MIEINPDLDFGSSSSSGLVADPDDVDWGDGIIFNGAKLRRDDGNTGATEEAEMYVSSSLFNAGNDGAGSFSANFYGQFQSEDSVNKDWAGDVYYTAVAGNRDYIRFYDGSYTDSDVDGSIDDFDKQVTISETNTSWLKGKSATVVLRGFQLGKSGVKVNDAYAKVTMDDADTVDTNDTNFDLNFWANLTDDDNNENQSYTVYYTIIVYDPDYVAYEYLSETDTGFDDGDCSDSDNTCEKDVTLTFSDTNSGSDDSVSTGSVQNKAIPNFVALRSWGYNGTHDGWKTSRTNGYASLNSYSGSGHSMSVHIAGSMKGGPDNSDDDLKAANFTSFRGFSCRDVSVCKAIYDTKEISKQNETTRYSGSISEDF